MVKSTSGLVPFRDGTVRGGAGGGAGGGGGGAGGAGFQLHICAGGGKAGGAGVLTVFEGPEEEPPGALSNVLPPSV